MSKPLTPKTEKETSKVKEKLTHAGFRSETAPQVFWGCKFIGLLIGLMAAGGTALTLDGLGAFGLIKLFGPVAFCSSCPISSWAFWPAAASKRSSSLCPMPST